MPLDSLVAGHGSQCICSDQIFFWKACFLFVNGTVTFVSFCICVLWIQWNVTILLDVYLYHELHSNSISSPRNVGFDGMSITAASFVILISIYFIPGEGNRTTSSSILWCVVDPFMEVRSERQRIWRTRPILWRLELRDTPQNTNRQLWSH